MKKVNTFLTLALLITFIYLRLQVRFLNPLWIDEIEEIRHLRSVHYLIFDYLPFIAGGLPGHFILVLPFNLFFSNKYILGLPGLTSQVAVFILMSNMIRKLNIVRDDQVHTVSAFARIIYTFDPILTFQSVEIRPYSLLPFFWMLSVFIVSSMMNFKKERMNNSKKIIYYFILICSLVIVLNWHYYCLLMILGLYLFFLSKERFFHKSQDMFKKSILIIVLGVLLSIPVWKYFSPGSFKYNFDTIASIPGTIMQIYTIRKGFPVGIIWQNTLYTLMFLVMLVICILIILSFIKKKYMFFHSIYRDIFIKINIFLVILPIIIIFLLDYLSKYWFLFRQFAWVMLPFYISIGVLVSGIEKIPQLKVFT